MGFDILEGDSSGSSSGYNSSTLNITRDRYYSSSTSDDLTYLKPFIREIYRTDLRNIDPIQTLTKYNASKTIQKRYPTSNGSTDLNGLETDDLPEVGLLYASEGITSENHTRFNLYDKTTRADVLNKYKSISFTVYGDAKIQQNIGKYYADGLDTFLYATDGDETLLDKTYSWAIMTKHLTDSNRLLCIPLIKKTEKLNGEDINVLRYHLNYMIKNAPKNTSISSAEYTDFIDSRYKGDGDSPSESGLYPIPIQLVYTKFTTVGPIGYDASYSSCYDSVISSAFGKQISTSIDEKYENRDRVIADSVPPYKLYSIFFYNRTLYLQEDYYTEGVTLHNSVKNNLSSVTMSDIMKYYYPPLLNEYGHAVKLASNLPENKLYILINGQGGGGAYNTVDSKSDKYKLANGGNAGNSASLILLMKDTYGTTDDDTYSSAKYPQCIIKIPAHPTQSNSCVYPMEYNGRGGETAYNCEILFKLGQKYIIASGKGGLSEECADITECVNENDSNSYDVDTDSSITALGMIYDIADGKQYVHRLNNGHYIIPFRLGEYTCQYNVIYDGDKTSTTSENCEEYYCECYTRGSYIQYGSGKTCAIVGGGTASIFACGGCASLQYVLAPTTDYFENINGSYGSGGGGWSSPTTLEGSSSKHCVAGAGGAAAFTISWYNTDY